MNFVSPSEHQILIFLVQIALLLMVARLLGQMMRRIGQPAVVGELAAGILLGPSILGKVSPNTFDWIFPADTVQSGMLFTVGWLGVMLLLVVTGFETDLTLIGRLGTAVVWVTAGSLLLPFAFGLGGGFVAPEILLGADADRTVFALFLATALTISSLPVIAKIMSELRLLRRNFGQLTLASAMANDVIGWVLLGLIAGLASSGRLDLGSLGRTLLGLVIFLAVAAAIGQRIVDGILLTMRRRAVGLGGWVTMAIVIALSLGAMTQALGVEAVLGAFIGGILLGRSRYSRHEVEEALETMTSAVLAPIFFATAGLRVDLNLLFDPQVAMWALIVILLASVSKFLGSMLGARLAGLARREGMALGTALNARGALEIVIATVGLSLGVLNDASYAIVVVMAIVTSVIAPPVLRILVKGWEGSPEEQARLRREEQMATNILLKPGRMLLPTRGGIASQYAADIVGRAFPEEMATTLLVVAESDSDIPDTTAVRDALRNRSIERVDHTGDPTKSLVTEAMLGFDLVVSGIASGDHPTPETLVGPVAATALMRSALPVLLVRPPTGLADHTRDATEAVRIRPLRRILLPVSASRHARAATEIAISLAVQSGAELVVVHVSAHGQSGPVRRILRTTLRSYERTVGSFADPAGVPAKDQARNQRGERLIDGIEREAAAEGVTTQRLMVANRARGEAIVTAARESVCDLVILGAQVQDACGEPFIGQTAETVLNGAPMTVAVVAFPPA
jgi:Kef-type K+ transport system membrane component KefB